MAGKTVKPKGAVGKALDKVKFFISGGPGKQVGDRLGKGLINMHKKKK